MNQIINFSNVSFRYEKEYVIKDISFDIYENDFVGIIGPNGGGKTTLLKLLLGAIKPNKGEITVFNQSPIKIRKWIGYLPQHNNLNDDFPITVEQVAGMGLFNNFSIFPFISGGKKSMIYQVLEKVDIVNLAGEKFGNLSGGQKQRCLLARAIISNPKILILDEPTASVDASIEKDIYELLKKLNEEITIILVSHDLGFISSYITRVFCVNHALVCHDIADITTNDIISEAYEGNIQMIKHKCKL